MRWQPGTLHSPLSERDTVIGWKQTSEFGTYLVNVQGGFFVRNSHLTLVTVLVLFAAGLQRVQASSIELHVLQSDILGREMRYNILLPEGYENGSERYPVLYLLRGHEREWVNPTEDGSRRGTIQTVYDALYSQGLVGRMIIVMPGLSAPSSPAEFGYILSELIPHIDTRYRTIPIRTRRGMDGFSYGGYDMLELLWRRPTDFITAGAYDGSFWAFELDTLAAAAESYWRSVRPVRFLIHAAGPGTGNNFPSQQFLSILESHDVYNGFDTLALTPLAVHNWFYADMHMERALPLHWEKLTSESLELPLVIHAPAPGTTLAGEIPVSWGCGQLPASVLIEYSSDGGTSWSTLLDTLSSDTVAVWNTTGVEDGTRYVLRIRASTDSLYGYAQTDGTFTLDNPGNGAPDIVLLKPSRGDHWSAEATVRWSAADPEGDPITVAIESSPDSGTTWFPVASTQNLGSYPLDTRHLANSPHSRLRLRASDGQLARETTSGVFTVFNTRPSLADTLVEHVEGIADGTVSVRIVDPGTLNGHRYRLDFHASLPKTFSVRDLTLGTTVLNRLALPAGSAETDPFDGIRLVLEDYDPPRVSDDSTRWSVGTSTLNPQVGLPTIDPGTGPVTGLPYPADYILTVYEQTVDTSGSQYGWIPTPVNFTVWNTTEGHQVEVLFADLDADQRLGRFDFVVILESDTTGEPIFSWQLFFSGDETSIPPVGGDVFRLKVLKPFSENDVYEFTADPGGVVSVENGELPLAFMLEQNFPNPFNPSTTITYRIPVRGLVRLEVFDLLGRRVATLLNETQEAGRHSVSFRPEGLASGAYIYRLDSRGASAAGKMLLLR